jgi:hypothetical protein
VPGPPQLRMGVGCRRPVLSVSDMPRSSPTAGHEERSGYSTGRGARWRGRGAQVDVGVAEADIAGLVQGGPVVVGQPGQAGTAKSSSYSSTAKAWPARLGERRQPAQ